MITFVVEDGTGVANATSYVSVEEADDIATLNIHNSDEWLALPLDMKRNLLMFCSRVLDSRTTWAGSKTTTTQALEWPRTDVTDKYKNDVSTTAIPYNLRWAVVELAKHNLTEDRLTKSTPDSVVSEVKIDTIQIKFADATSIASQPFYIPDIVMDLVMGYGTVRGSSKKVTFGVVNRS